jgi:hypothetical protein
MSMRPNDENGLAFSLFHLDAADLIPRTQVLMNAGGMSESTLLRASDVLCVVLI